MKILAIETSCDETCAAVSENTNILSNIVWSQVDLHKEFGGVVPSLAKRAHEAKIDSVISKAFQDAKVKIQDIDAVAVTVGPGLAIALEVGIKKAKELAASLQKPLIAVNHIEGHVVGSLSPKANFPCLALVVSGGHTELILVKKIGDYQIIAQTTDDALGEALDKAARMLGLGYPGGAELEKTARSGNFRTYSLPLPMSGREGKNQFSYSGLKTAFYRLVNSSGKKSIPDLAAGFQNRAFEHLVRVTKKTISNLDFNVSGLLVGGGVAINQDLRQRLEVEMGKMDIQVWWPAKGLYGDNAAMIGLVAHHKIQRGEFVKNLSKVDRLPRWRIDEPKSW